MGYPGDPELLAEDIAHIFQRTRHPQLCLLASVISSVIVIGAVILLSS